MSLFINTNTAATNAANNLSASNAQLQNSLNKLSSGSRIVKASDDAGGLAAAMSLTSAATNAGCVGFKRCQPDLVSCRRRTASFRSPAILLTRMSQLTSLGNDPTMSTTDEAGYTTEITQLQS